MKIRIAKVLPALLVAALAINTTADTFTDDFEGGNNTGGWVISGAGEIQETGGNPGAWLRRSAGTFAPIARTTITTGTPFVGDFRQMGVTQISLDAQTLNRDFGQPQGFLMSLLLRDTKGTPNDPSDDDYAYFVGPQVPQIGEGWKHFDFDVPSQSTDDVPAGWSGGWAGDGESFRPGITWSDVITNVDQVEIWWIHPAWFAILSNWTAGIDNVSITTDNSVAAELIMFGVTNGTLLDGELVDLIDSDDSYVHTRSGFGQTLVDLHNMEMVVGAITQIDAPELIDITLESRIDEPAGLAQVRLRNWNTNDWEMVGNGSIGSTDSVISITDINATNYVNDRGDIEAQIKHLVFVPFLAFTFESFVDQVEIVVR